MEYKFTPTGVCSVQIGFEIENDIVKNVRFLGGCSGNTQGVARLCEGRDALEVADILEGIRCGGKNTSCPDQLAKAIRAAIE